MTTTRGSYRSQTPERERERVKVRHYNTHRGLPKGLTINCASHQMPTGNLMTTVIILKVRWIGEPWEWTRYSLLVFRIASHVTATKKKKKKEKKEGRNETNTIGLFVSSDNERLTRFHVVDCWMSLSHGHRTDRLYSSRITVV